MRSSLVRAMKEDYVFQLSITRSWTGERVVSLASELDVTTEEVPDEEVGDPWKKFKPLLLLTELLLDVLNSEAEVVGLDRVEE
jgi:hypothetical protein